MSDEPVAFVTQPSADCRASESCSRTGPFFLVGAERSGTTIMRLMLDSHPRIAWLNEFEYAVDQVRSPGVWPRLETYYRWLGTHRVFQQTGFSIDRRLSYTDLVRSFLEECRSRAGKPIVGATVHRRFDCLLHIWPQSRFVHLVRDPRAVSSSLVRAGLAGNVYVAIEQWLEVERLWDDLKRTLDRDRFIELKYETLVEEPVAQLQRVCEFIGVAYDDGMLSYPSRSTYTAPHGGSLHRWQQDLSVREIQLVESRFPSDPAIRGYGASGHPPISIDATTDKRLRRAANRYQRRFRLRRYGFLLLAMNKLSRMLRWHGLSVMTARRMHKIQRAHLQ